ncbi:TonB-dependent receptor [Flammeovirgaceae bacterium SG7u.132]|nr:TonB-dependent receptor [Flammeovirgaceae bacterium SG7u.132]
MKMKRGLRRFFMPLARNFLLGNALLLLLTGALYAQDTKITGKVTSVGDPEGLPGVSIVEKGTTNGVITSIDGSFSITVPKGAVLIFSFLGFVAQEIEVGNQSVINPVLKEDVTQLEEVVVVGYGTVKKSDLTGSVATLSGEDLRKAPTSSAAEAISGRIPGVNVLTTDGSPDAEIVIRVRGGGSVTQDNSPLYVVDGFIVSSIRDIPPADITSINVLKDAAATAIYGAQAANGVVVITTKSPKAGKTEVNYNGFVQVKQLPQDRKLDVLGPYEYVMAQYENAKLRSEADLRNFEKYYGKYDDLELYNYKKATDWQDELFGNSIVSQFHNLSINGGTEKTKLVLSLTHNDDKGILVGSGFTRDVVNFKINHEVFKGLKLDASARVTNTEVDGAGTSGSSQLRVKDAVTSRPVNGIADELDIDLNTVDASDDYQSFLLSLIDPTELAEQDWRKRKTNSYVFNAGLTWDIVKNLTLKSTFTSENSFDTRYRYYGPLTGESQKEGSSLPLGTITDSKRTSFRWLNTLSYKFNLGEMHDLDLLLGHETYSNGGNGSFVRAEEFRESMQPEEMFANMALGNTVEYSTYESTESNRLSFFARANYQLNNKYLVTATVRSDASSKFSEVNRLGIFPAIAVGWKISEEPFMSGAGFVEELKLRASYGQTGNDRIPANATQFLFTPNTSNGPGMGTNDYNAYYSPEGRTLYNPDIVWETTINRNIGLDFTLFNARIYGNIDVYDNSTKDLLLASAISPISGFNTQWNNVGTTSNKGVELALSGYILEKDDFSLKASVNFGINRSTIDELDGTDERFFQSNWASTDLKDRDDYYLAVGRTIGLIYGYVNDGMYSVDDFAGYDEVSGNYTLEEGVPDNSKTLGVASLKPGYMKLKDLNGDGEINSEDRQVIGSALPKATGGFGLDANFKGFDASVFFNFSYGNDIYNTGKLEFNQYYRTTYGNMLDNMSMANRFTYIDVDGSYTGVAGDVVTDLEQLRAMNNGKEMWSHNGYGTATAVIHDWAVEDGSFIRLNNATLGYSLPANLISKIKMQNCRIYVTGYNLFLWTNYSGYDPEVSTTRSNNYAALTPGIDYSAYPRSRSYTAGVNITF